MELLTNPLFLMCLVTAAGLLVGQVSIGRFKLGVSGVLFTGIAASYAVYASMVTPYRSAWLRGENVPATAARILGHGLVDKTYFDLFLLLFVATVGLLAAKDVGKVFRGYGVRFLILAAVITSTGAAMVMLLFALMPAVNQIAATGVYTGALTSSPGLGVALESVAALAAGSSISVSDAQASVGLGYAVAYPFSVMIVITGIQLLPKLLRIDVKDEVKRLREDLAAQSAASDAAGDDQVDYLAFMVVCLVGFLLGKLALPLGGFGKVSLETTGGVLVAALVLGSRGKVGPFNFTMSQRSLGVVKEISLLFFLAYVGLNYGHQAVAAISGPNILLVLVGALCTATSLVVGALVGRYLLKMNWVLLSGAICGGMTSTPGLGAAMDSTGCNEVAGGYGSTYPIGLLCKVILVLVMNRMVF
ncbi:MAG: hypothetical protein ACM3ZQ_08870 [Bacillota bacterium]